MLRNAMQRGKFARSKATHGLFRVNRVTLTARRSLPVFLEAHEVNGLLRRSSESKLQRRAKGIHIIKMGLV
jgi:hypothetical protein